MIKVHVHVLGYGWTAREVCEQALRGGGCFGHLMRGSTEFSSCVFSPVGQKALRGARIWLRSRVQLGTVLPQKCQVHICTQVPCFQNAARASQYAALHKMQPKLHNSADQANSKFVYLRLCLVVCFYPQPPTWPWLWGHSYRQLACVEWVLLLL